MSWRTVVVTRGSKIDLKLGYMVVRDSESTIRIHIDEISIVLIETTAVSITAALLNELIKNKVKVIFCDEKHNPSFEMVGYYNNYKCSEHIKKQISWSEDIKKIVWSSIIKEKIINQSKVLEYFDLEQFELLCDYADEITIGDSTNREGHAAKVYFNALFGKEFSRNDELLINAALNYGYSILLSAVNREIVCSGDITQIGIHHDNVFNQFNLGCDLMEPFRPIVDFVVKNMDLKQFETDEKRKLVEILNFEYFIDNKKNTLTNVVKIYVKSVIDALDNNDPSIIKFFLYEL